MNRPAEPSRYLLRAQATWHVAHRPAGEDPTHSLIPLEDGRVLCLQTPPILAIPLVLSPAFGPSGAFLRELDGWDTALAMRADRAAESFLSRLQDIRRLLNEESRSRS